MAIVKRRKRSSEVKEVSKEKPTPVETKPFEGYLDTVVSTGSTLLDLAISGGVTGEGGVPGGILMEIYGPNSTGKTAVLSELCASAVVRGGDFVFLDPEARLDTSYAKIYDVHIDKKNYESPDTVAEVFDYIYNWKPKKKGVNIVVTDSIASLSTELELGEKGDKMGMARGKAFSAGLRKTCRMIRKNNWIIACANQVRQGPSGEYTPGGFGVPFHASLRMRIAFGQPKFITKEATVGGSAVEEIKGIHSIITITKSSVDVPFRTADVYIIFGHGIDDIRANLLYCKKYTGATKFDCFGKEYVQTEKAINYIEENDLEAKLRQKTIQVWNEVKDKLHVPRKPKVRI